MPSTKSKQKTTNSKASNKKSSESSSINKTRDKSKGRSDNLSSKLPNVFILSKNSYQNVSLNPKQFAKVTAIYFLVTLFLVRGFGAAVNIIQLKNNYLSAKGTAIGSDFSAFGSLLGSSLTGQSAAGNVYQTLLFIIFSLIFIWTLRQVLVNKNLDLRSIFYKSQTPLIPFIIVLFFLVIDLIPAIIGLYFYAIVFANNIAIHTDEKVVIGLISLVLIGLGLFLLLSSIFAIYIVTLPDVRPIQAIRSSWDLVKKRRMVILRKMVFLFLALSITILILSIIFIAIIPAIASYIFVIMSILAILVAHAYIYNLYRAMI